MANSKLTQLKDTLGIGARLNKYKVMLAAPQGPTDDVKIDVLCKGGAIPAKTVGIVEVWNQGRKLIIAGDSTFENTWTLTFWDDESHSLRKSFDDWLLFIDDFENHKREISDHNSYMTSAAKIQQLSTIDNSMVAEYNFHNLWPTSIAAIEMADETIDTLAEFTVDFAYSHWVKTA